MPTALINGINIHYEVNGHGFPLVWSHEFGGNSESWDAQVNFFSRHYQVITYSARGYPPSDVPSEPGFYSQDQSVDDLYQLLQFLGISKAYIGGLSMGGGIALNMGITHPDIVKGLILAGVGTGSTDPERLSREATEFALRIQREGIEKWGKEYAEGPTRIQLRRKDPKTWENFRRGLMSHSTVGSALTLQGVQKKRPSILTLGKVLRNLQAPTLIIVGDEDDPCLEASLFMKRNIPRSGLVMFPQSGHTVNLEEPGLFNKVVSDFLTAVEGGRWEERCTGTGLGFMMSSK